jgi:VanZ family protein
MWKLTAAWWKSAFGWAALVLWLGIIFATLYPFELYPRNDVEWLKGGLRFGQHGIVMSDGPLMTGSARDDSSCSIEILLKPGTLVGSNRFLVFSSPSHSEQIKLTQYRDGIILWRAFGHGKNRRGVKRDVVHFFNSWELMLLTLTSGPKGTSVYSNGRLLERFPTYTLSREAMSGTFAFGTDTSHIDTWTGQLRGLALYARELSPVEVAMNYQMWMLGPHERCDAGKDRTSLFTFQEGQGAVIRNLCPSGGNLTIPPSFVLSAKPFLATPWQEFAPTWDYVNDLIRNILGFVPFGFALCGYLWLRGRKTKAVLIAILIGAASSFGIEILQGFIPQRESGLTDVLTNTLGTALGALLFTWRPIGRYFHNLP